MIKVSTQEELNKILSSNISDLDALNIDLIEDNEFNLGDGAFLMDCSKPLIQSYMNLVFTGNGNGRTSVVLINCEKGDSFGTSTEVNLFNLTMCIVFRKVHITTDNFVEIQFGDREELQKWTEVSFDRSKVQVINIQDEILNFFDFLECYDVEGVLQPGDHVVVSRGLYTHHGIYIGDNKLIHYSGEPGVPGIVSYVKLEHFARGNTFWVYKHENCFSRNEIINRAKSRVNEEEYNLIFNNCEHFCHWCCTGQAWSNQVVGAVLGLYMVATLGNDGGATKYRLSR